MDGTNVYWATEGAGTVTLSTAGTVMSVPIGGGMATTLLSGSNVGNTGMIPGSFSEIAVEPSGGSPYLYANDFGGFNLWQKTKTAGGTVAIVNQGFGMVTSIAEHSGTVVWSQFVDTGQGTAGGIFSAADTTSPVPTELVPAVGGSIALDTSNVYWVEAGTIVKVPLAGGNVTTLATGQADPIGLSVDSMNVYWANGTFPGNVVAVPIAGGTATTFVTGSEFQTFGSTASDGINVYFVSVDSAASGSIQRAPVGGGPITVVVSGLDDPIELKVDSANIYWTDYDNGTDQPDPEVGREGDMKCVS